MACKPVVIRGVSYPSMAAASEALEAQALLNLRQAKTEFWKVGIACLIAGAAIGGVLVQAIS